MAIDVELVAQRLKGLMEKTGESLTDLHRGLIREGREMLQTTIRDILTAKRQGRVLTLRAIAEHYGEDPRFLFDPDVRSTTEGERAKVEADARSPVKADRESGREAQSEIGPGEGQ